MVNFRIQKLMLLFIVILVFKCNGNIQEDQNSVIDPISDEISLESSTASVCVISSQDYNEEKDSWTQKMSDMQQQMEADKFKCDSAAEANADKIQDLQRTVERKKNDAITAESMLKNCNLDKTVASESLAKYKETISKLGKEIETLKTQLQFAQQKSLQAPKCPACPAPKKDLCPVCLSSAQSPSGAADLDHKSAASCDMQQCAALLSNNALVVSQAAFIFATETVPAMWADVGYPACKATWNSTVNIVSTSNSALRPFYEEHILPRYQQHVAPYAEKVIAQSLLFYETQLAETVHFQVLPTVDYMRGQTISLFYYAYKFLDIEDLPLNLWLTFAKSMGGVQRGLRYTTDAMISLDPRLSGVASFLVHGAVLLVLFLMRRIILSIAALIVLVVLSPILLVLWLVTLPFRKKKSNKIGAQLPPANHAMKNPAVASIQSSRAAVPPPFPQVPQLFGSDRGVGDARVWGDEEPMTTPGSLAALRRYEREHEPA